MANYKELKRIFINSNSFKFVSIRLNFCSKKKNPPSRRIFTCLVALETFAETIAGGLVVGEFLPAKFVFQMVVEQYFPLREYLGQFLVVAAASFEFLRVVFK